MKETRKLNVVYFGTDVFLPCFEYLASRHRILALYTYHNNEDYFTEYAIVRKAATLGIPVYYEDISLERIRQYIEQEGCDLFFVAEYNRILPVPEGASEFRGVNTHSSLLPQGRSYYPIEAGMERRLPCTGVTMHKITSQLDGGAILAQRRFPISPDMDSVDIYLRCSAEAVEMLEGILADFEKAWASGVKQERRLPYWGRPADELLTLRHAYTVRQCTEIFRRYNAMTQVELNGKWHYVTSLMSGSAPLREEILPLSDHRWLYRVADGHLRLTGYAKENSEEERPE